VVPELLLFVASLRGGLARIVGLRWASVGRFDLAVPAVLAAVVWTAVPQLGGQVFGIPFWAAWLVGTAVVLAAIVAATSVPRVPRPAPGQPGEPEGGPEPAPGQPGGSARSRPGTRRPTLGLVLVVGIVVSWVLYDAAFWGNTNRLYDLNVYLGAAGRWLDGGQPYMTGAVTSWPSSARSDFFLYPPPLLPVFGLLSRLPEVPVDAGWVVFLVACAYWSYRLLGLPRIWSLALLAFPPMAVGFESGNVASLTFLLFVTSIRAGGALVVDGLFKVQTGVAALWLVRQRRWRGLLAGAVVVAAIALFTLPLVGLDSWRAWWDGLGYRAASQAAVPGLYGYSYAGLLPGELFAGISIGVVLLALLFRGRPGLAALGLATIFASPALWPHGFVFALPAALMLENGAAVWLLLGAGAFGSNMWLLFYGAWLAVIAARRLPDGSLHPLAGTDGPWPSGRWLRPRRTGRSYGGPALSSSGPAATAAERISGGLG
jgi:Glycosyltransferase family 87